MVPLTHNELEVEGFDPVARAAELAVSLPRQWCGTFEPFDGNPTVDVTLDITQMMAMGQMVDPIKFLGIGEKIDNFEAFHPERIANRILGMGDIVWLTDQNYFLIMVIK